MALNQRNAATQTQSIRSEDLAPLNLSAFEQDLAMDAIAQLIPHLDLEDCQKVIELAQAQATILEIMDARQASAHATLHQTVAA